MADPVYQKATFVGTSSTSFSDATSNAVAKASATFQSATWFEVCEERGSISDGKVSQYQVTISVGYRIA